MKEEISEGISFMCGKSRCNFKNSMIWASLKYGISRIQKETVNSCWRQQKERKKNKFTANAATGGWMNVIEKCSLKTGNNELKTYRNFRRGWNVGQYRQHGFDSAPRYCNRWHARAYFDVLVFRKVLNLNKKRWHIIIRKHY